MRVHERKSSGLGSILLGMAALILAGMVGTIGLLQHVGELGPKVGDIVAFEPVASFSRDMKARVEAVSADTRQAAHCVLDVRAMHANGGSLVIEARQPHTQRGFRVHWAGRHSSDDGADCGSSAELLLNQDDLEVLAMAAGGFGVAAAKPARGSIWTASTAVQ
jgi:hypothetical protein